MEEINENLEMSLFSDQPLELNFEDLPEIDEDELEEEEETSDEEAQDEQEKKQDTPSEDPDGSETVAEEEDQDEEGSDDDDSPNLYSSFASVLSEQGLLPSLDLQNAKIESIEDLTTAFKGEISNQVKTYLVEKLGEQGYEAIEKGISLQEYQQYENDVNVLENITEKSLEDDLELAKRVIYEDYVSQGIDEKRVMRLLKKTIDLGEESILEDAKESLESLKAFQQKKLENLQLERERQQKEQLKLQEKIDNDLKNTIYNSDEYIKGLGKVDKNIKDRVYNSITKIVGKSPQGIAENQLMRDRRENPIEFDTKLYYLYELTGGFKDFSKLVNKSQSNAISKLEKQLRKTKFEDSGAPSYMEDPESYGGFGSELVL